MNECVKGLSPNDVVTCPHAFLSGYMKFLDLSWWVYDVYLRIMTTPLGHMASMPQGKTNFMWSMRKCTFGSLYVSSQTKRWLCKCVFVPRERVPSRGDVWWYPSPCQNDTVGSQTLSPAIRQRCRWKATVILLIKALHWSLMMSCSPSCPIHSLCILILFCVSLSLSHFIPFSLLRPTRNSYCDSFMRVSLSFTHTKTNTKKTSCTVAPQKGTIQTLSTQKTSQTMT